MDNSLFVDSPPPDHASNNSLFVDAPAPTAKPMEGGNNALTADLSKRYGKDGFQGDINYLNDPKAAMATEPEQGLLDNAGAALAGLTAIPAVSSLGKLAARGVGKVLEALPATENLVPSVGRIADNQLLKSLGGSAAQVRQMGPDAAREAAEVGRKVGLDKVFSTQIGREKALKAMDESTGSAIGALRDKASTIAPAPSQQEMADFIKSKLGDKFTKPEFSGEVGQLKKLTDNLAVPVNPTYSDYAKRATDLNHYATGEKLKQPVNAITDVANGISKKITPDIVQSLGSTEGKQYLDKLADMSALKKIEPFMQRGETREMAGRGGGGLMNMLQSLADKGGYRAASAGADALHSALSTPTSASIVPAAQITPAMLQWLKAQND